MKEIARVELELFEIMKKKLIEELEEEELKSRINSQKKSNRNRGRKKRNK